MTKQRKRFINNSGATLVLVIICMLFVGIIAAVVLRMTVGNRRTIQTVQDSSENFYSTETIVDDIKIYLQKQANTAAVDAYADVVNKVMINPSIDLDAEFEAAFKEHVAEFFGDTTNYLNNRVSDITCQAFDASGNASSGNAVVAISSGTYDEATNTLKGVVITYTDEDGYSSTIVTDFSFAADRPEIMPVYSDQDKSFGYEVDKYIVIANNDLKDDGVGVFGSWKGNIYAGNDINLNVSANQTLQLWSQYVVAKNNINVINNVIFRGLDDTFLKPKKEGKDSDSNHPYMALKEQDNASMYADNIVLGDLSNGKTADLTTYDSRVYAMDDLSLDGDGSKFYMKTELADTDANDLWRTAPAFYGLTNANNRSSSAIVLNGTDTVLDISKAREVKIAGTAYTKVPAVYGVWDKDITYLMQGDSITHRSLQTLYMVPGDLLDGVFHNPINSSEYAGSSLKLIDKWDEKLGYTVSIGTDNNGLNRKMVKFVNNGTSPADWYIYWNFTKSSDAADYIKFMYDHNKSLMQEKIRMIGNGSITIPSSNVHTEGVIFTYDSNTKQLDFKDRNWDSTTDGVVCSNYATEYTHLKNGLSTSSTVGDGKIYDKLFGATRNIIAEKVSDAIKNSNGYVTYDIAPADYWTDGAGMNYTGQIVDADANLNSYQLVIGNDFEFIPESNVQYIVIAQNYVSTTDGKTTVVPACVTIKSGEFHGLIISEGDVKIGSCVSMTCFRNAIINRVSDDGLDTGYEYTTEFAALLHRILNPNRKVEESTTIHEDKVYPGTILLKDIFNAGGISVLGGTANGGDSTVNLTTINTGNWSKY